MMVSYSAQAKTLVNISEHMKKNQLYYMNRNGVHLSGMFGSWSGSNFFAFFVTPIKYEWDTVFVRLDKIIRLWKPDGKDLELRETNCKQFPCSDERGKSFSAPLPLKPDLRIGDTIWLDKSDVFSKQSVDYEIDVSNVYMSDDPAYGWGF